MTLSLLWGTISTEDSRNEFPPTSVPVSPGKRIEIPLAEIRNPDLEDFELLSSFRLSLSSRTRFADGT